MNTNPFIIEFEDGDFAFYPTAEKQTYRDTADDYRRNINGAVGALWRGSITYNNFLTTMGNVIERGINSAWEAGSRECGILPTDRTKDEQDALDDFIFNQLQYLPGFADWIAAHSRDNGYKLKNLTYRVDMWVTRYREARTLGKMMACGDKKQRWRVHPEKEHCTDCLSVGGKVYRASTWLRWGWYPKSQDLECGGFACGCELEDTDERCTPGHPPRLS